MKELFSIEFDDLIFKRLKTLLVSCPFKPAHVLTNPVHLQSHLRYRQTLSMGRVYANKKKKRTQYKRSYGHHVPDLKLSFGDDNY